MTSPPRIEVSHLSKHYPDGAHGEVRAVDDLSFAVEPGRVTGFLGPNGAGKTTTLRMALDLVAPTAGGVSIGGRRYVDLEHPTRVVGAVLEASAAHAGRTGRNHLRAGCLAMGLPFSRADEVLDLVGLVAAADRRFKGYSLGMRQRLGIATAMLGDPGVLILDEPANGLDPEGIRWMRELLQGLAAEGRTVLVSSHLLSEMQELADDVVIVAAGRLVSSGSVHEVIASMAHGQTLVVTVSDPARLIGGLDRLGARVAQDPDGTLLITGTSAQAVGDAARSLDVAVYQLRTEQPDLEDAFLALTGNQAAIR